MLGFMQSPTTLRRISASGNVRRALVLLCGILGAGRIARAQACTTQAKMTLEQRTAVGSAAYKLAMAVGKGDTATVQSGAMPALATNFVATANLIHGLAPSLGADSFAVTQLYLLDASGRSAGDASEADFSCSLKDSAAEVDFSIAGLPAGRYAFAMVEGSGPNPWLLSFLLQADAGGGWKMAGFYPHRREAAGHAGIWYWTVARADAKSGKPWLAWLMYGEADELLRPANFLSTTNLDRLRGERRDAAPPALSGGLSDATALAMRGPNGAEFRVTGLASQSSDNGKQLNLVMHFRADSLADANAAAARNMAAGTALLGAHPELRSGFDNLWVIAEAPNVNPFVTERPIGEFAAAK